MTRKSIRGPFKVKGSDFWYVEIRGKRRSLKTEDRRDAERIIAEIRAKDVSVETVKHGMPLYQFRKKYLEWSSGIHKEGTTEVSANCFKKLEAFAGEDRDISDITPQDADRMLSSLRNAGSSPSYCNIILRHCRASFQKAVERSILDKNPLAHTKLLAVEKKPPQYLEHAQIEPFLRTIKDQDFRLLIAAYLVTGRRRVELLRLTWDDVDFENRRYYVRGKAHLSRWFPMGASFKAILELMPRNGGRIWPRWKDRTDTHKAKSLLRSAGLGHLHLHHLRHSFAVNYLQAGGEIGVLQDLLGHSQISTTLLYGRVTPGLAGKEVERVGINISALV